MARSSGEQVHTIHEAVLRARGCPLQIEALELAGPRDDEVLVRIVAAGVCRTDIDLCDGGAGEGSPVVLGHEGAGIVEEVGSKVTGILPADHVVLSSQAALLRWPLFLFSGAVVENNRHLTVAKHVAGAKEPPLGGTIVDHDGIVAHDRE